MEDILHNSDRNPNLLAANRDNNGRRLNAYNDRPDDGWDRGFGFAFFVPQLTI